MSPTVASASPRLERVRIGVPHMLPRERTAMRKRQIDRGVVVVNVSYSSVRFPRLERVRIGVPHMLLHET